MYAILPDTDEEVMFTDCSDIPYEVTLSDNVNFEVEGRARKFIADIDSERRLI